MILVISFSTDHRQLTLTTSWVDVRNQQLLRTLRIHILFSDEVRAHVDRFGNVLAFGKNVSGTSPIKRSKRKLEGSARAVVQHGPEPSAVIFNERIN